uniref:Cysteine and serine rich nuclear protein 1 n=1 Tax=Gasterosteus aculeatus aculeatus TaxID=481459 RepID=G3PGK5_GASAC
MSETCSFFKPHLCPRSLPFLTPAVRSILKRPGFASAQNNVRFDRVTVFGFPRCQGFSSVPSHGGATLGMARRHSHRQSYTLAEHALERRHARRERLRERRRTERLEALKQEENGSGDQIPDEDGDVQVIEAQLGDAGFLQPYSSKQGKTLLQAAGVKRVDREEKRQLHALRVSREACGCDCRGFCEPETCACSQAGITCQVDRSNFPCGCTKEGCGNTRGRIEFNATRVHTHYLHTVMKLELERRLQDETPGRDDQTGLPDDLGEYEDQDKASAEDGLPLTMPATPPFHFAPERLAVEENSCSSDMTDSSCSSSDSDAGRGLSGSQSLPGVDAGLTGALSICDSENDNHRTRSQTQHPGEALTQHSGLHRGGPLTAHAATDSVSRSSQTDYLDENANQARDFFDSNALEDFPNTPSPTVDSFSGGYMDLSLSSDSDMEFFDSDYASGPLHSSFKVHRHPDSVCHLQLFSSVHLPRYEWSTDLLESLIGLTEAGSEQGGAASGTRLS